MIKKPDSTKKMSTPRNPPGMNRSRCPGMKVPVTWMTTISSTATARTPSKAGTNPMVRTASSRPVVSPANGSSSPGASTIGSLSASSRKPEGDSAGAPRGRRALR